MRSGVEPGVTRVLVLGGSGFIGQAVTARLLKQPEIRIRVASRGAMRAPAADAQVVRCDLLDAESLAGALSDVDVVIDCCRERSGEAEAGRAIANLLAAVEAAGVRHLVYLSSIAAYGAAAGAVGEDVAPVEPLNWYGRAKRDAEIACRRLVSDKRAVTILRPSLVYGPGGEEWSLDFIRSIMRGHLQGMGRTGDGWANLVHVDDLAAFCAGLALQPARGTAVFNVNGIEQVTFNAYFAEIAKALRDAGVAIRPPRRPPLLGAYARPVVRRAIGPIVNVQGPRVALHNILRRRPEDRPGSRYASDTRYLVDRAIAAGFSTPTSLAEGTRQAVRWAIASGRIRGSRS